MVDQREAQHYDYRPMCVLLDSWKLTTRAHAECPRLVKITMRLMNQAYQHPQLQHQRKWVLEGVGIAANWVIIGAHVKNVKLIVYRASHVDIFVKI